MSICEYIHHPLFHNQEVVKKEKDDEDKIIRRSIPCMVTKEINVQNAI